MNNNLFGKDTTCIFTFIRLHNHKDALNAHQSFEPTVRIVEMKTEHDFETIKTAKFVTLKLPSLLIFIKNKG